jgi:hypothetical protein
LAAKGENGLLRQVQLSAGKPIFLGFLSKNCQLCFHNLPDTVSFTAVSKLQPLPRLPNSTFPIGNKKFEHT